MSRKRSPKHSSRRKVVQEVVHPNAAGIDIAQRRTGWQYPRSR